METFRESLIISVNIGEPKKYTLKDVTIETSMVKSPVSEIHVKYNHIVGDRFANPNFHGTLDAVVYALQSSVYKYWENFLNQKISIGLLGENLTLTELNEAEVRLGDIFKVGDVHLQATGPRYPCNKLNYVTSNSQMQKAFEDSNNPGVYFKVLKEGTIKPNDKMILLEKSESDATVLDLYKAIRNKKKQNYDSDLINKILKNKNLDSKYLKKIRIEN